MPPQALWIIGMIGLFGGIVAALRATLGGASPVMLVVVALLGLVVVALSLRLLNLIARLISQGLLVGVAVLALAGSVIYASGQPPPPIGKTLLALAQRGGVTVFRATVGGLAHARLEALASGIDPDEIEMAAMPRLLPDLATATAPSGGWVVVAHTDGDGVYLRATPRMADRLRAWGDGTQLAVIGEDALGDGHRWKRVRDPSGQIGWVPAEFVAPLASP